MRILMTAFLMFSVFLGSASLARADYYVWQDLASGMSLTFPDTWKVVNNIGPDDVLTIMAPSGRAHAACRIRTRQDRRFSIYPSHFDDAIQRTGFSRDFWNGYLGEYNNAEMNSFHDGAGMGRGFASYAEASYEDSVPWPLMNRKALMFASLYNNTLYIVECSAHKDAYDRWKRLFLSIVASVDFKKVNNGFLTGHYRNFMADPRIMFDGDEGNNVVSY